MKSILIVEDEAALLNAYVMMFKKHNFKVLGAANGKIGLEYLRKVKFDVLITDVLMPIMDGIELLRAAKVKEIYPEMRVIVLSNLSDSETLNKVKKLGADEYLLKASVSPTELITAVKQCIAR